MNSIFNQLRQEPLADLSTARVGVVGCGSVGSHVGWQLASAGVGALSLVDRDHIEFTNLRRHLAGTAHAGQPKAAVVQHFIQDRFPAIQCNAADFDIVEDPERTDNWLESLDLVIVAVDSESPKYLLDSLCRQRNLPAIYGGVYGAGWAVEAIHVAADGPCYGCAARSLGRVGVPVELPATLAYAIPTQAHETGWIHADLTSIQTAASCLSRLACAILQAQRGCNTQLAEWPGFAWRFPLRAIPAWNAQPWQRITVDVTSDPSCLICGSETPL